MLDLLHPDTIKATANDLRPGDRFRFIDPLSEAVRPTERFGGVVRQVTRKEPVVVDARAEFGMDSEVLVTGPTVVVVEFDDESGTTLTRSFIAMTPVYVERMAESAI